MIKSDYFNLKFIDEKLVFINQVLLPHSVEYIETEDYERIAKAIEVLEIRGAPAIGIAAAYALSLSQKNGISSDSFSRAYNRLASTRPTAVNLFWALNRMKKLFDEKFPAISVKHLYQEAVKIHDEDIANCDAIGKHGLEIFPAEARVITHCNTGKLAVGGEGTAFNVIRIGYKAGLVSFVYADETRPLNQGSRLTAFELGMNDIPFEVISDSTSGFLMKQGKINIAITGADRIAKNGDTANKIGTYSLAVLCKFHNIPFYIAAPTSTIDCSIENGSEIPIEIRASAELLSLHGTLLAPLGTKAYTPAFDVVPSSLISGIITEEKLHKPPYCF